MTRAHIHPVISMCHFRTDTATKTGIKVCVIIGDVLAEGGTAVKSQYFTISKVLPFSESIIIVCQNNNNSVQQTLGNTIQKYTSSDYIISTFYVRN